LLTALGCGTPAQESGRLVLVLDGERKVTMEFVRIKAATFTMGGNLFIGAPSYEVTLTRDFWLQTTETTQAQWEAIMGRNPAPTRGADLPVTMVNWEECQEFLKRLSEKAETALPGRRATLPTVAEWKYACGKGESFGDDHMWYQKNSEDRMHPVARKKPNALGLYDLHGNVQEWCADWDGPDPRHAVTDPAGPKEGTDRRLCGGAWHN
jgi:formylglycine-generating enzyme required for sulfatase activity